MKFAISSEQKDFFNKHHSIEFEGLLDSETLVLLNSEIDRILSDRLKLSERGIARQSAHKLFMSGRDFWRDNEKIGQIIRKSRLARYAADLVDERPLRIGFDQLFKAPKIDDDDDVYLRMLKSLTLKEASSLQGLACGLMLCLKSGQGHDGETSVFSHTAGHGVFMSPEKSFDYDELVKSGGRYLLIVYTQVSCVYTMNKQDPQLYSFKKYGYSYGDKLLDSFNPIVCR